MKTLHTLHTLHINPSSVLKLNENNLQKTQQPFRLSLLEMPDTNTCMFLCQASQPFHPVRAYPRLLLAAVEIR